MWRAAAVVVAAGLTAGCYAYEPVSAPPEPGRDVRVRLTAPGALEMSEESDEPRRSYEGRLERVGSDEVTLSVVQSRNVSAFDRNRTLRNNVVIPRNYVERFEARELSGWRTSAVAAAAVGVAGFLVFRAGGGGEDSGDGGEEGGGPVAARIPFPFVLSPP